MAETMDIVLDLQMLEVPETDSLFGSSCTSSTSGCCNGGAQQDGG